MRVERVWAGAALLMALPWCAPAQQEPHGQVVIESHGEAPEADADRTPMGQEPVYTGPAVTDAERAVVAVSAYDLEVHADLGSGRLDVLGRIEIRNRGEKPMTVVPLQISSALHWTGAGYELRDGAHHVPVAREDVDTDTDHTGVANELVLTLPEALQPGGKLVLLVTYGGVVKPDATRLTRIGASAEQGLAADWDAVGPEGVRLRGFGNVLWYPVAAKATFLGDGAALFDAMGAAKLAAETQLVKLRLTVLGAEDLPVKAVFCGETQPLTTVFGGDTATAQFAERAIGFRGMDLFTVPAGAVALPATDALAEVSSKDAAVLPRLSDALRTASALPVEWFGPKENAPLVIVDQAGQPFEDGALLVAPVDGLASSDGTAALVHSLTHAWVATGQPWMDEGLAQFLGLLWAEHERGREAATGALESMLDGLAIAEPANADDAGQPLVRARDEMFYRRKAAAVWWMLRDIVGEDVLKRAIRRFCAAPATGDAAAQAVAFEKVLEAESKSDLGWFFQDWILQDKGLPDLSIVDVVPRPLPAGQGHDSGWLVAVTMRNAGTAVADVPLVLRAPLSGGGTFSKTVRERIPAGQTITERVVLNSPPTEVTLNDGTTPELRTSLHTRTVNVQQSK